MTKEVVLSLLLRSREYISGEEISRQLGISRAAVNTAIQTLRREGFSVSSATNRGYRLEEAPDTLREGAMLACLPAERMATVRCLQTVGSTNEELRRMAREGAPAGQSVVADAQTAGRGRRGRSFSSPRGVGIYLSYLLRPETAPADTASVTAWTAVAVCRAIRTVCGAEAGIKWVNDLVLNRKKICGILTELSVEGESGRVESVVVGIGINGNSRAADFPPEVAQMASSLLAETGKPVHRARLAAEIIRKMDALRQHFPADREAYLAAYRASCVTVGQAVAVSGGAGTRHAVAESVDEAFGLVVRYEDGSREHVASGEVSVRGLYGYV